MQNAAPHKASLASCETTLWFQANASCSSPYLDYRQVTSSIDDQTFKLLPAPLSLHNLLHMAFFAMVFCQTFHRPS